MRSTIHFSSNRTHARSTPLAALPQQNPHLHAGRCGPLAGLFDALPGEISESRDKHS